MHLCCRVLPYRLYLHNLHSLGLLAVLRLNNLFKL